MSWLYRTLIIQFHDENNLTTQRMKESRFDMNGHLINNTKRKGMMEHREETRCCSAMSRASGINFARRVEKSRGVCSDSNDDPP